MKKIILILILFLSCYVIYNVTKDNKLYYVSIGDFLAVGINNNGKTVDSYNISILEYLKKSNKLKGYNNSFVSREYRVTDLIRILEYNETVSIQGNEISLNQLLKKADILTISLGTTELYYRLFLNTNNMYLYVDDMINDIDLLLDKISTFSYNKVLVLGYYNITKSNDDIFNYANYELKKVTKKYGFEYVNLDKYLSYNPNYFEGNTNFYPNNEGYKKISTIIVEKISES